MLDNVTVTLSLQDFERIREGDALYRRTASRLAACFDYSCTKSPPPPECAACPSADKDHTLPKDRSGMIHEDCVNCAAFQAHDQFTERLTVDVERLIRVAKDYSLWGKDAETDLAALTVEKQAGRAE